MEQHFELIGVLRLQMHQNIQWIHIKVCQLRKLSVLHIGSLSPTICGLFLYRISYHLGTNSFDRLHYDTIGNPTAF